MQFLCIGIDGATDNILQELNNELKNLENRKINYTVDEIHDECSNSIICGVNDDDINRENPIQSYKTLKLHVSNALAEYIIKEYEEKLISRIINSNYCYFNAVERKDILKNAVRIVRNDDKNFFNSLFQIRRRNVIFHRLIDYFESHNSVILDGFVNFRLKDYVKDLEEIVDKAVDDFLMEREYKEFIRLLKYFVDIQEPKFDTIHVLASINSKYIMLDGNKNEITNECINEFINEISEGEINYDDLLVSSLITFAPKKIIIHSPDEIKNKELLETIKNVFTDRVLICSNCEICIMNMVKN